MNIEIIQQQKFEEQFSKIAAQASQKFKDKWDQKIVFISQAHSQITPSLNPGALHLLSVKLREEYEILRKKYFEKSL